jgi:hypothetical protein
MQPPRPAVLREDADDAVEVALHFRRHIRTGLAEVFEIGRREHQHLAGAVVTEEVVPVLVRRRLGPVEEVLLLGLRLLGEEIVGDADRELSVAGELLHDGIILRTILEAAAGIDRAGDTQPVQFAHEVPGRIELVLERKLRALGERRVEDRGKATAPA